MVAQGVGFCYESFGLHNFAVHRKNRPQDFYTRFIPIWARCKSSSERVTAWASTWGSASFNNLVARLSLYGEGFVKQVWEYQRTFYKKLLRLQIMGIGLNSWL